MCSIPIFKQFIPKIGHFDAKICCANLIFYIIKAIFQKTWPMFRDFHVYGFILQTGDPVELHIAFIHVRTPGNRSNWFMPTLHVVGHSLVPESVVKMHNERNYSKKCCLRANVRPLRCFNRRWMFFIQALIFEMLLTKKRIWEKRNKYRSCSVAEGKKKSPEAIVRPVQIC